ncbi:alpha-xylosidase, partial [Chloroflexia bacterium SDU3-3]
RLKARGLHISAWINPYIAQRSPLFAEGAANGYLIKRANGDVWQWDLWQPGMAIVDFTNPAACAWFADKLRGLMAMGVDTFKTDFGERIPTDAVYFDGADPQKMHNYYTQRYNQVVFDVLEEGRGKGEAVVFARSATAGGQQYPVHWGGDNDSTFPSMAESLRGGLSLGLSGFGFWSHDIGGFEGMPNTALYKRWIAFGLLSSHSRLHGSSSYRVPWLFDEEAVDVLRQFTTLKCRLMPYLYARAVEAHTQGVPVMRAMLLEFPDDPASATLDRQYMLGDALLVAPVFSAEGKVTYYVPAGRWTSLLSGEELSGPAWRTETHGVLSLPLLVRPGTVLPLGANDQQPAYAYAEGVTLAVYAFADGDARTVTIPTTTGEVAATATVRRTGDTLTVAWDGPAGWALRLVGQAATAAQGGALATEGNDTLLTPAAGVSEVAITLA